MRNRGTKRYDPCVYGTCSRERLPGRLLCVIHQKAWDGTQMGRNGYQPLDIKARPTPPRAGRNR